MQKHTDAAEKLFQLIEEGTSPFHVVQSAASQLQEAGFEELELGRDWNLNNGGKYFMVHHGSCLLAFAVGEHFTYRDSLRIAAAHTDFPGLRIKVRPEVQKEGYQQLNVEVYGGAILNTWLDRPLSVSGRVALRSEEPFYPEVRLVDLKKPLLVIPNMAIHFDREMNNGVELNRQKDMLPLAGVLGKEDTPEGQQEAAEFFLQYLAKELQVEKEDILDFELGIYNRDPGDFLGLNEEFISAPRLDDLTSVQALLTGIIEGRRSSGINMIALFDHEEVGSHSKQGAGSSLLTVALEKIFLCLGRNRQQFLEMPADSMLLSVDVGHAIHPNKSEKSDITAKAVLGRGLVIKENSGQSYATDCEAIAIVQQICDSRGIPYQKVTNRSDIAGGSTIGPIASTLFPVKTVDVGVPLLAMHSARELMGTADQAGLVKLLTAFYSL